MSNSQRDEFIANCLKLETVIRVCCSKYSQRECSAVFVELLSELCSMQKNPIEAMEKVIYSLNRIIKTKGKLKDD